MFANKWSVTSMHPLEAKYKVFHSIYSICMTDMTQTCSKILGTPDPL